MNFAHALGMVGLCCALAGGCASTPRAERETYVVRAEDTLYSIAWRRNLDFHDLARWNALPPDYRIAVGQVLLLEAPAGYAATAPPASRPPAFPPAKRVPAAPPVRASRDPPQVGRPRPLPELPPTAGAPSMIAPPPARVPATVPVPVPVPATGPASAAPPPAASPARARVQPGASAEWVWPTTRRSAPRPVPGGGILLLGQLGQAVRAANAGRVVYVGSGIRGYGNLIILKHGDSLLSAYAHNRDLLVSEGQEVASGQNIARMGEGPHQVAALYFEIRLNGRPVDPLKYLASAR